MSKYILPYDGKVKLTSGFGHRVLNGKDDYHFGIDLVGLNSKIIYSPCEGFIEMSNIVTDKTNKTWEWGNYIRIKADSETDVYLCHLSERFVEKGDYVLQGQPIGYEGDTGYAFGQHLHLEFRKNGKSFDPCELLGIKNKEGIYEGNVEKINDWSIDAIIWAIKYGILKGYSETEPDYKLDKPVTREEMITFLYRLYKLL